MKNSTEGATALRGGNDTVSPADFPLRSAKSRAVARALLRLRRPPAFVAEMDEQGRPIFEADRRYGEALVLAPPKLTVEEWAKRYAPEILEEAAKRSDKE